MSAWQPRLERESALQKVEAQLAASPNALEPRLQRAALLAQLGRTNEAKTAYLELLAQAPAHFTALNEFANIIYAQGFKSAALTAYTQAVAHHPDNPIGHVNLANLLAEKSEAQRAIQHYEIALQLDPDHAEAHRGLAYLFTQSRDETRAAFHREKAFRHRPFLHLPYRGQHPPIALLLLVSASGGTIPMRHHLPDTLFQVTLLFTEFYDPATPLPPHQILFNAIGDADLCRPALHAALVIAEKSTARIINHPSRVLPTGRLENARRLAAIPDVITPKISLFPRAQLEATNAPELLAHHGFTFPLLLRAPGFHTGHHFYLIADPSALAAHLPQMPGPELMILQYLDARRPDGKIGKYRVMVIDGQFYPLHLAIAHEWKIHYFTADMADHPAHRAQDAAFLADMPQALGPRALHALQKIHEAIGLDYYGLDFSLNAAGQLLLFEANATMVVNPPASDPRWNYRRPAVQNILDAIHRLLSKD